MFDHLRIWKNLKKVIKDNDLKIIANADNGMDFTEHYEMLHKIIETGDLPKRLQFNPREVLEITVWEEDLNSNKTNLLHVLFCSVLLLASAENEESEDLLLAQPDTIIIALECAKRLGQTWIEDIYAFFNYLIPHLHIKYSDEDLIYFNLALYLAAKLLNKPPNDISRIIESIINAEQKVSEEWEEGPCEDILGYTCYDLEFNLWRKYLLQEGSELELIRKERLTFQCERYDFGK